MTAGSKKGCGCAAGCNCGKTPAKQTKNAPEGWTDADIDGFEAVYNQRSNFKRKGLQSNLKPEGYKTRNLSAESAAEEKKSGKIMRGLQESSNRIAAENRNRDASPNKMWGAAKVAHGKKKSPAKMGCGSKRK